MIRWLLLVSVCAMGADFEPPALARLHPLGGRAGSVVEVEILGTKLETALGVEFDCKELVWERTTLREAGRVRKLASRLAEWDVWAGLADVAHRKDFIRPEVDAGEALVVEDARHPVVEELAPAGEFVPNDVTLDTDGERLVVVTGPNMAGKSTLMRQVALLVILAQMGSYVPARRARVGVVVDTHAATQQPSGGGEGTRACERFGRPPHHGRARRGEGLLHETRLADTSRPGDLRRAPRRDRRSDRVECVVATEHRGRERLGDLAGRTDPLEVDRLDRCSLDRKSTRLNSSHIPLSRMPSSA